MVFVRRFQEEAKQFLVNSMSLLVRYARVIPPDLLGVSVLVANFQFLDNPLAGFWRTPALPLIPCCDRGSKVLG